MKVVLSQPAWGAMIIEDTETREVSFQCLCGGVALYWQRVELNAEDLEEIKDGTFDADRMLREVCKKTPRIADRLAPPFEPDQLSKEREER